MFTELPFFIILFLYIILIHVQISLISKNKNKNKKQKSLYNTCQLISKNPIIAQSASGCSTKNFNKFRCGWSRF